MWFWLLSTLCFAEEPDFQETVKDWKEEQQEPEADLSAEFGGSLTVGNTEFFTVSGALRGGYRWRVNRLSGIAAGLWGRGRVDGNGNGTIETDERQVPMAETARRVAVDTRYDRFFGDRNSLYALVGTLVDPFSGYDLRSHEQIGYSRHLAKTDHTDLIAEIGVDFAQENYVEGVEPNLQNVLAGRAMFGLQHNFSEHAGFSNTVEVFENLLTPVDLRVNNIAALSTRLNGTLSLKLSHELRFDNQPVEGFRPLDQTGLITVTATLL